LSDTSSDETRQLREAWVTRVLGVHFPKEVGAPQLEAWLAALDSLETAFNSVSSRIEVLRQALANQDEDEDVAELVGRAEFGINGFTDGRRVALTGMLLKAGRSDAFAIAATGGDVRKAAQDLLEHLQTDERIAACDENPADIEVGIVDTLRPALGALIEACRFTA